MLRRWSDDALSELAEVLQVMIRVQLRFGFNIDGATFTEAIRWPSEGDRRSFVAGWEQVTYCGLYCLLRFQDICEPLYMLGRSFRRRYGADAGPWHGRHCPFPIADPGEPGRGSPERS